MFHSGLPAFFHDWTWPLFRERLVSTWQLQLSAWAPSGFGHPNSVPTVNPLAWLKIAFGVLMPADAAAKAYLWFSVAAACAGVYRLARSLGVEARWASFAATTFAVSPYLFAKIASGQSSEWAAIAAFIWGLSLAIDAFEGGATAYAAALLFALSTNQLQFLVFAEIVALIGLGLYRDPRAVCVWLILTAGAAVFALPSLWFLAQRGALAGAEVSPPYGAWEYSQSSSIGDAFALLGYSARYPEQFLGTLGPLAVPLVRWSVWGIGLLAAAGALTLRRNSMALGILGVVGIAWISGVRGPIGPMWEWTFIHAPWSAFLREFYHGATMLAVPYAVLAAAALARLARYDGRVAYVVGAVLVAGSGGATLLGGLGRELPHVSPPAYAQDLGSRLPHAEGFVLFLPPERPLFVAGDSVGGTDAFDWASDLQRSLFEYYPVGPLAYAAAALDAGHGAAARQMLARMGCDAIVWRPDIRSPLWASDGRSLARSLSGGAAIAGGAELFTIPAPPIVSGARAAAPLPASLRSMSDDPSTVYLDVPGADAASFLPGGAWEPDPAEGWVGYRDLYWKFERGLATPTLGAVTTEAGAQLNAATAPAGDMFLWAPHGAVVNGRTFIAGDYVRVALDGSGASVRALGPAAVGETGERPVKADVRPSRVTFTRAAPWRVEGIVYLNAAGIVVARWSFDPQWVLDVDGAKVAGHFRADGSGNAWVVKGDGARRFTLIYAPQRTAFALLAFSLLAAIGLGALAVRAKHRVQ